MKLKQVNGDTERAILTGMIVNSSVLSRIATKWRPPGLFRSDWSNLVGQWCIDFHSRFGKAPRKAIQGLFNQWAERKPDKELHGLVEGFLSGLSDDYRGMAHEINSDYLVDTAATYFTRVRLEKTMRDVQSHLAIGAVKKADKLVADFHAVEMGREAAVNVMTDKNALKEAFAESSEPVLTFDGALGTFFGDHLQRDAFVALMAPEGRGKSFVLQEMAWRGMEQRRRVAYFILGDMSKAQVMRRLATRASGWPTSIKEPVRIPIRILRKHQTVVPKFKTKTFRRRLSWQRAWRSFRRVQQSKVFSKQSYLRMATYSANEISVAGIEDQIKLWAQDGWTPDIVVIDYADNLDMPKGGEELRHKMNEAWKEMRALSQHWHCLVLTATQSDADSYEKSTITRANFTEDKRKFAHVTGFLGLNQTMEEKQLGIYRFNWLKLREGSYSESRCVHVAGCLALANPMICSCF